MHIDLCSSSISGTNDEDGGTEQQNHQLTIPDIVTSMWFEIQCDIDTFLYGCVHYTCNLVSHKRKKIL